MLQMKVIKRTKAEWASPIPFVVKEDGSIRICIQYWKMNALTFKDVYQIFRIEHCAETFSTSDVQNMVDIWMACGTRLFKRNHHLFNVCQSSYCLYTHNFPSIIASQWVTEIEEVLLSPTLLCLRETRNSTSQTCDPKENNRLDMYTTLSYKLRWTLGVSAPLKLI